MSKLSGTMPGEMISALEKVYKELEEKQERFQCSFSVSCKKGCGECCEHYVPFLTQAEALLAAYIVLKEDKEFEVLSLLNKGDPNSSVCPLYKREGDYHCSLYEGRSMVCRLFGFSVSMDKEDHMVWRACKWKEKGEEIPSSLLEKDKEDVPVMSEYGERLEECSSIEGETIYSALPKAIWKIKMISKMTENNPA